VAETSEQGFILWTDGSKLANEQVDSTIIWKKDWLWKEEKRYFGKEKVFDTEVYIIFRA
jgi:hypothetical protein